jgi:hypothetical protein
LTLAVRSVAANFWWLPHSEIVPYRNYRQKLSQADFRHNIGD